MTSTQFASRYRLLKNVATRGARSFLAQQVELGRMVMVHYLDSEKPQERAATLARLQALTPPARGKLLEIADVDGSPVAVTLFLSSFVDFATWLDSVSPGLPAPPPLPPPAIAGPAEAARGGDFTQAFQKLDLPRANIIEAPTPNEERRPALSPRPGGDFTSVFGKIDEAPPAAASAQSPSAPDMEDDSPTLIMPPPKAEPRSEHTQAPPSPPRAPAPSEGGFTAIFGRLNETSLPAPSAPPPAWPEPVAPPATMTPPPLASLPQPALGYMPAPPTAPAPAYAEPAQPGEFTQLFQRISPAAGSNMPSYSSAPPAPFRAPEIPRPIDTTPAADLPHMPFADPYHATPAPLPLPSLGAPPSSPRPLSLDPSAPPSLGAVPAFVVPPAPNFSDAPPSPPAPNVNGAPRPPAAPAPVWGASTLPPALGSSLDVGVQSEFTRILGRVAVPPPPPPPMAPPTGSSAGPSKAPAKSVMPLLVALNVVVLLTLAIVAYFMLRKH